MDPDNSPPPEKENGWTARSRATRQKLISAASKLIVEKGINSVSVVAVAKAAGVTRPGAYYHFKTREALLDAVRNETDHQLVRTVAGSKEDKYLYSQAAEFAAEDQDAIYLRIQRMLEQGPDDVILQIVVVCPTWLPPFSQAIPLPPIGFINLGLYPPLPLFVF